MKTFRIRTIGEMPSFDNEETFVGVALEGSYEAVRTVGRSLLEPVVVIPEPSYDALVEALEKLVAWKHPVDTVAPELGGLLVAIYNAEAVLAAREASS